MPLSRKYINQAGDDFASVETSVSDWNTRVFTRHNTAIEDREKVFVKILAVPTLTITGGNTLNVGNVDVTIWGPRWTGADVRVFGVVDPEGDYVVQVAADGTLSVVPSNTEDLNLPTLGTAHWDGATTLSAEVVTAVIGIQRQLTVAPPAVHADEHAEGGSDPVTPESIGADPAGTATAVVAAHNTARDHRSLGFNLPPVLSRVDTLPGSPTIGDRYLLTDGAHVNEIAEYVTDTWVFTEPADGMTAAVLDEDLLYLCNGAAWVASPAAALSGTNAEIVEGTDEAPPNSNGFAVKPKGANTSVMLQIGDGQGGCTAARLFLIQYQGEADSPSFCLRPVDDTIGEIEVAASPDSVTWYRLLRGNIGDESGLFRGWIQATDPALDAGNTGHTAGKFWIDDSGGTGNWTLKRRNVADDGWETLAGSAPPRGMTAVVLDAATALTTGDGKFIFVIPALLDGYNLTAAHAAVDTVSSSGTPTVQIRNVTDAVDMLSTPITIDASEYTSYSAATPPVIDTTHDDVATGDRIAIDVDVAGTGTAGLQVMLTFAPA